MRFLELDRQIESKEIPGLLTFHHARPFEVVRYGIVSQVDPMDVVGSGGNIADAKFHSDAYKWLEDKVGFYPLFMAVGRRNQDAYITGYPDNWKRVIRKSLKGSVHRKAGEHPNIVLFSFEQPPKGSVYTDHDMWNCLMPRTGRVKENEVYSLFKPSWNRNDWITKANSDPGSVQLLSPELDLRDASAVYARNDPTKRRLEDMGFKNVKVARLRV